MRIILSPLNNVAEECIVIAVNMPNEETVGCRWRTYSTTVDDIEAETGYDFLSNVPKRIQAVIEALKGRESETGNDEENTPVGKKPVENREVPSKKPDANSAERKYVTGPRGGCYYINGSGKNLR